MKKSKLFAINLSMHYERIPMSEDTKKVFIIALCILGLAAMLWVGGLDRRVARTKAYAACLGVCHEVTTSADKTLCVQACGERH